MKCPNCGNELKDGRLYCDKCGHEIRIVPDFEPEVEANLDETLHTIAEDLDSDRREEQYDDYVIEDYDDADYDDENDDRPSLFHLMTRLFKGSKAAYILIIVLGVLILGVLGGLLLSNRDQTSYEQEYASAVSYAENGEYTNAIEAIERAIKYGESKPEDQLLRGDYYIAAGQIEDGINIYTELIDNQTITIPATLRVIDYYLGTGDYDALNKFLLLCKDEDIQETYTEYMAKPPVFNVEGGSYDKKFDLQMEANTEGTIYYTLNGTTPDENSAVYSEPILLDIGMYNVKAIFVNANGQKSDTAEVQYLIDASVPVAPELSITDGVYETPEYIVASIPAGCTVYYTTDGTTPTLSSAQYTRPIPMQLGDTIYKFVSYNNKGIASEETTATITLDFYWVVGVEDSVNSLVNALVTRGILTDNTGYLEGKSGHYEYECNQAFMEDQKIYYLVLEQYVDLSGTKFATGNKYAIDSGSGMLYHVSTDAEGHLSVYAL